MPGKSYQSSDAHGSGPQAGRDGYSVAVFVDGYMDHVAFVDRLEARRLRWQLYKINRTLYIREQDGYESLSDKHRQTLVNTKEDLKNLLGAMDAGRIASSDDVVLPQEALDGIIRDIYKENSRRADREHRAQQSQGGQGQGQGQGQGGPPDGYGRP